MAKKPCDRRWGESDSDESFSIAMEGAMILPSPSLATFKEYIHQIIVKDQLNT